MAIQILGLRKYKDTVRGTENTTERFFEKKWRAESVAELFKNIETFLSVIPVKEQYNLYYTCADCLEEPGRKMVSQSVIPFDIDGIEYEKRKEYIPLVCKVLQIEPSQTGILFSGNGLQFIVGLKNGFTSKDFFDSERPFYRAVCDKINKALHDAKLPGHADPSVFSAARIMRLPLTENRKPGKENRKGELYYRTIEPVDFDLKARAGIPRVEKGEQVSSEELLRYPPADPDGVLKECHFMKWCGEFPESVQENLWYAMLSISARLPDGRKISHDLSAGHPKYTHAETENKIEQALQASNPRTCENINKLWGKCAPCPHYGKIKSPISIKSPNYIGTEKTGFHATIFDKDGAPKKKAPNYEDLRRFFERQNPFVVQAESETVYTFNGKYYEVYPNSRIKHFADRYFIPLATDAMRKEFMAKVKCNNLKNPEWFMTTTERKVNFQNGILDLNTSQFSPHTKEIGFRYVLPFEYKPEATAEKFSNFLTEICGGDGELKTLLLEFMGYALSNDECWIAQALLLHGDGANGKSTLLDVLRALAGENNYSSILLSDLKEPARAALLDGKLFNAAEETPVGSLKDTAAFKNLVGGGMMICKQVYENPYQIRNRAKFIFSCNELPGSKDMTRAYTRRLLLIPLTQTFQGEKRDPFLYQKLLNELPGIFNLALGKYESLKKANRKDFTASSASAREQLLYLREIDSVKNYVDQHYEINGLEKTHHVECQKEYGEYDLFCQKNGIRPETSMTFFKRLARIIPRYEERRDQISTKEGRVRVLYGIKKSLGQDLI